MHHDADDMSWARALVDEGRASLQGGQALSLEEHRKRIERKVQQLDRK
jgi:hypothetical protein